MEKSYIAENRQSRERLIKTINSLSESELQLVIYKEGWTVAVTLGHLAFWDERRRQLIMKWQQHGFKDTGMNELDNEVLNDTLIPFFKEIPAKTAAALAIKMTEALDKEIELLTPEMLTGIRGLEEEPALDRATHRNIHLDEIEALLKDKRSGK
jgi:hypothetical protein